MGAACVKPDNKTDELASKYYFKFIQKIIYMFYL